MNITNIFTVVDEKYRANTWPKLLVVALGVVFGVVLPHLLPDFYIDLLINTAVFALIATAFNFAFGFAAVPSFGHATFFAIGGYGVILTVTHSDQIPLVDGGILLPVVLTLLISIVFAVVMGVIALRGIGLYFALLTFGLAELFHQMLLRLDFTGRSNGLIFIVPDLPFGFSLDPMFVYYLTFGTLIVTLAIFYWILNSPFGRAMRAVRANDQRAKYVGYATGRVKLLTFAISAFFTTFGGMYLALYNRFVGPGSAAPDVSLELLFMSVIGGTSYLLGPGLGAVFLSVTEFYSEDFGNLSQIIVGTVFIVVILYAPAGLYGKLTDLWRWLSE